MQGEDKEYQEDLEIDRLAVDLEKITNLKIPELVEEVKKLCTILQNPPPREEEVKVVQEVPGWLKEMRQEYDDLKRQALAKKQVKFVVGGPKVYAIVTVVSLVLSMALLSFYLYENHFSEEAYARRAYEANVACNDKKAAGHYSYIRRHWSYEKKELKAYVEHQEQKAALFRKVKDELTALYNKEVVVDTVERSESGDDLLAFWRCVDDVTDSVAHFWPDGKIDVAGAKESRVTSLEEAHRYSKEKFWTTLREATETR